MGAKQSKRSVDISGKEAESAGEVAAAGAGGEGRVEPLADADALKPQLNGDAHIHEQTDKEKQLDSGTPENEKDATTEKEEKQDNSENDKAETPVTNGDGEEQKTENGESAPTPEDAKKPKKEKVKKKWSLRSISFSRKDKPKQEKKQKEEEPKTNGEPEKVPEEAAEVVPEPVAIDVTEVKSENETKDEKTPETPVTEPITNGSNTPESPRVEIPVSEETPPVANPESDKTEAEPQTEPEPEQLPVNGLSLEEPKIEVTEVPKAEENRPDEPSTESSETAPAVEIPVQKEVCVEQMPLIESTPPPLPANPPPSSVASFAATTMAPDLTDASLANTTEIAKCTPPITVLDTKIDAPNETSTVIQADLTNSISNSEVTSSLNESIEQTVTVEKNAEIETIIKVGETIANEIPNEELPLTNTINDCDIVPNQQLDIAPEVSPDPPVNEAQDLSETTEDEVPPKAEDNEINENGDFLVPPESESIAAVYSVVEDLPPPPVEEITEKTEQLEALAQQAAHDANEIVVNRNSNYEVSQTNGIDDEHLNGNEDTENENIKNKIKDALGNVIETIECNGNTESIASETGAAATTPPSESLPPSPSEAEAPDASDSFPAPPRDLCEPPVEPALAAPQELLAVSDKIADLVPEVPVVPELKTETEAVAVAEQ